MLLHHYLPAALLADSKFQKAALVNAPLGYWVWQQGRSNWIHLSTRGMCGCLCYCWFASGYVKRDMLSPLRAGTGLFSVHGGSNGAASPCSQWWWAHAEIPERLHLPSHPEQQPEWNLGLEWVQPHPLWSDAWVGLTSGVINCALMKLPCLQLCHQLSFAGLWWLICKLSCLFLLSVPCHHSLHKHFREGSSLDRCPRSS